MPDKILLRLKRLPLRTTVCLTFLLTIALLVTMEWCREELEERIAMQKQPLMWAVYTGDLPTARHLLKSGASATIRVEDPNWEDVPRSALLIACDRADVRMARLLLENGAKVDLNVGDGWQNTPVCTAIKHGNTAMLKLLIQKGADANVTDGLEKGAKTALTLAIESHNPSAITLLRQYGARQ